MKTKEAWKSIGVFDSGVGGLTVIRELEKKLPGETLVYFGDTARVPYGTKSPATVTKYAAQSVRFLISQDIKLLVVACNTASAVSLDYLKDNFKVPVIGVIEPGVRSALKATRSGRVGVIGTSATISSQAYRRELKNKSPSVMISEQACPLFVPLVEEGWVHGDVPRLVAAEYLSGMKRMGIDTLILGCTHYPVLKHVIGGALGKGIKLVDSAHAVSAEAKILLEKGNLLKTGHGGKTLFFVSDIPDKFTAVAQQLLGRKIAQATQIDIEKY